MDGCTITGLAFIVIQATVHCPQPVTPAARFCELAQVIRYSRHDTPETIRQARVANAKFHATCPGR